MNVEILPREVSTRDPRFTLQTILRKWLPLPDSLLRMVVRCMPSPRIAQRHRSSVLQTPVESHFPNPTNLSIHEQEHNEQVRLAAIQLAEAIDQCDTSNCDDVVVFVSKMTPVKVSELCAQDIQMLTRRLREKAAANDDGIGKVFDDIWNCVCLVFDCYTIVLLYYCIVVLLLISFFVIVDILDLQILQLYRLIHRVKLSWHWVVSIVAV